MIEIKHLTTGEIIRTVGADTLRGANLYGADLSRADLRGADLSFANLYEADLRGADLSGVDLSGVDLRRAIINPSQAAAMLRALGVIVKESACELTKGESHE